MIMIQTEEKTRSFDAELSPMPNQMMNSGSNASGGIGRSSSTGVSKNPRARLESPIARPIGTPIANPPAMPLLTRRKLAHVCSHMDMFRYPSSSHCRKPSHVALGDRKVLELRMGSSPAVSRYQPTMMITNEIKLNHPELRTAAASPKVTVFRASMSPDDVSSLMSISSELGQLNYERYQDWDHSPTPTGTRQALFAFNGEVYRYMERNELDARDITHVQKTLRILSGLYGVLRPLDEIQPYRLKMGSRLETKHGSNLYEFWGNTITDQLNKDLAERGTSTLINLASNEYFSSVVVGDLDAKVISPVFKDFSRGDYRVVSFFAKRARGMMASYLIRNRVSTMRALRQFAGGGYRFNLEASTAHTPAFLRNPATTR